MTEAIARLRAALPGVPVRFAGAKSSARAALHEAGHVIAAIAAGGRAVAVHVEQAPNGRWDGWAFLSLPGVSARSRAVIWAAGMVAEGARSLGPIDGLNLLAAAEELGEPPLEVFHHAKSCAREILYIHRRALVSLSTELAGRGTIHQVAIQQTVRAAGLCPKGPTPAQWFAEGVAGVIMRSPLSGPALAAALRATVGRL
jgi:hypothetical protein